jgi:hypothetical protein
MLAVRFESVLKQKRIRSNNKFIRGLVRFWMANKKNDMIRSNFTQFNLDRFFNIQIVDFFIKY